MALDRRRREGIHQWAIEHRLRPRSETGAGMILELLAEIDNLIGELDLADEALTHCVRVVNAARFPVPFPKEFLESGRQTRHQAERHRAEQHQADRGPSDQRSRADDGNETPEIPHQTDPPRSS